MNGDSLRGYIAASRANRLAEIREDSLGMAPRGGGPKRKLGAAARELAGTGDPAREAWGIAERARGATGASAYLVPQLGGWYWGAVVGDDLRSTAGAVLLTIGPDGDRSAQRASSMDHAWAEFGWVADAASAIVDAPTPSAFDAFRAYLAGAEPEPVAAAVAEPAPDPEPERVPLPWVPAAPDLPEFAAIRRRFRETAWRPVAEIEPILDREPEPVAAPARRPGWFGRMVRWVLGPWWDGAVEIRLPQRVEFGGAESARWPRLVRAES